LGGLKVDSDSRTAIEGLYAAGENAGGIYGADRVGSYLTACTVFGLRAGRNASKTALNSSNTDISKGLLASAIDELHRFESQKGGRRPGEILKYIKEIAGKHLACERNAKGLQEALQNFDGVMESEIHKIQIKTESDVIRALEIRNMCLTGKLIATAALHREESRGQHHRSDCPSKDSAWLKHIILQKDADKIEVTTREIG
jgi:succinate dehydrogenase/fumarate reductase flavoprotein subunit